MNLYRAAVRDGRAAGLALWAVLAVVHLVGRSGITTIDLLVVLACVAVVPLAFGARSFWLWLLAGTLLYVSFRLDRGAWAALLGAGWVALAVPYLVDRVTALLRAGRWRMADAARVVAVGYGLVAGLVLVLSRAGVAVAGIGEPIVELTTVHYAYAGAGATAIAVRTVERFDGSVAARIGLVLTAVAPPVVAVGFLTDRPLPQVGGALLLTGGVYVLAVVVLRAVVGGRFAPVAGGALAVSAAAVFVPMVLAVAWAAAQHWPVPALGIPDMVRLHGLANGLGFTLLGLIGWELDGARSPRAAAVRTS